MEHRQPLLLVQFGEEAIGCCTGGAVPFRRRADLSRHTTYRPRWTPERLSSGTRFMVGMESASCVTPAVSGRVERGAAGPRHGPSFALAPTRDLRLKARKMGGKSRSGGSGSKGGALRLLGEIWISDRCHHPVRRRSTRRRRRLRGR